MSGATSRAVRSAALCAPATTEDACRGHDLCVLVLHDAPKSPHRLVNALDNFGFKTEATSIRCDVVNALHASSPAVILFDSNRCAAANLSLCTDIRRSSDSPLVLMARGDEADRLLGFELGVADYIGKPVSVREVIARMKAILRRTLRPSPMALQGLTISEERFAATLDGQPLDLTAGEFRLLALLASAPGRAFERKELCFRLHNDDRVVGERAVDSLVKHLRRKLTTLRPGRPIILTVYGTGYTLCI